ncbi:MAG: hypothetical protein WC294_07370 [Methanoregula sp.]|jgi:hypothetical protein
MSDDKPCCAADALRRIRQMKINGLMTGITMPDEIMQKYEHRTMGANRRPVPPS